MISRRNLLASSLATLNANAVIARAISIRARVSDEWQAAAVIQLWPGAPPGGGFARSALPDTTADGLQRNIAIPVLHVFRPVKANGAALMVIPGGAYAVVATRNEGLDVARDMTASGYTVFVLGYRLPSEGWADRANVPLQDAQRAMRLIRARANLYGVDPRAIAVLGFSAGGHLGATLATDFFQPVYRPVDRQDEQSARPAAIGLAYPVIAIAGREAHPESSWRLLGHDPAAELIERRSPAKHVSAATPPMFLMHALDDEVVSPDNSLAMMAAMRTAGRPVEAHLFAEGGHGFGRGPVDKPVANWLSLFVAWLDRQMPRSR